MVTLGSVVTLDGDVALEARSPNLPRQSSPFLHVRACSTVKVAPHTRRTRWGQVLRGESQSEQSGFAELVTL